MIATSSWINIYQVGQGAIDKNLSYYISFASLALIAIYMIVLFAYLLCNVKKLDSETESVKTRAGALYEGYAVNKAGKPALLSIFFSLTRRMTLGLIITFGEGNPLIQFFYIHYSSIFIIGLIGLYKPMETRAAQRFELASEFTILVLFSHFICQTDLVTDLEARSTTGWSIISVTSLSIVLNFLKILWSNVTFARERCRVYKLKVNI